MSIREIVMHDSCMACLCPWSMHTDNRSQSRSTTATGFSPVRRGARRPRSAAGRANYSKRRSELIGAG